ncbi:MAG TPA: Stk1 family PASTA domain-containing Ser/Thr kinase [Firmicutes bacterium]|nr:Stk1 family PASTA domain-containing Ser/Thr kinase [Bacillota bacterium]
MIGRTFGSRYQVQEKIGQGGMAVVYKGLDTLLGRTVTIKVLRENLTEDPDLVRSFRREAYAAASLSHPNIVNVYDVGKDENAYYIVMEYIEGKTLKEIIQEEGQLTPSRAVSFARQICDALHDAHRHNIIHRDIKPQNILITRDGRVKVTDFGIARAVTTATITYTSSVMGSVHYFSPEQAQGGVAKEKSDLYSVGIVLYEMLTGKVPFSGDSPVSVALKHVQEEVPPLSGFIPDIPLGLENLVMKAVEKNPDDRFSSAEEFSRELQLLEEELSKDNEKNSINGKPRKGARKKKNKLSRKQIIGIAVGSIVLITLIVTGYLLLRSYLIVPEVVVPEIEGLTLEQGISKLQAAGLKFEVEQVPSRDVEAGHIISQDPEAGRKVRKERVVQLLLSTGPSFAEVPNVVGKSELDARIALGAADLEPEIEERYSDEVPVGQVIEQFPEGGSRLLKGETVKIIISKGGQPVKLKDLRGLSLEDAKNWLETYDLRVGFIDEIYSDVPKGKVVSQFPEPDQMVPKGDAVDLVLSKGPDVDNLQVYRISITIPPDRIPPGSEIEITVEDVLGKRTENIIFDGEEIVVEGYGSGKVTIKYQDQEIATESFPD